VITLLDTLLLQPLLEIYSTVLELLPGWWGPGVRVMAFAVVVNVVLAPVYRQMEHHSRGLRGIREQVAREVARMRRHFRGRELYFYTRAIHRQYRYHPASALLGSADLFVQILVFATAYRFLSDLPLLAGARFGPIADLSRPDALLGAVNLLPLLMTAFNAASVFAYEEDRTKRLQSLALAAVFLVLLYRSPSGLVLYWTVNNLFSLLRNLVVRRTIVPGWLAATATAVASQR
jgi:membrane protein insertase Oxa1/YidC/SpoIIIJ